MIRFLCVLGLFCASPAFGQTFRNIRVLKEEEKIIITYDLIYEEPGSKVVVKMFGSHNNFESPVLNATGNIGEVLPGPNRRIEWDVKNLPKNYKGFLDFRFKGEVIHGWTFTNPKNGKLRRGKDYIIRWTGGLPGDTITLSFISPGMKVTKITTTKNVGYCDWQVPRALDTGRGYSLKISKGKEVYEQQIFIKRKTPLIFFAIPVAGVAIFLGLSGGDDSGGNESLPDAPKPN